MNSTCDSNESSADFHPGGDITFEPTNKSAGVSAGNGIAPIDRAYAVCSSLVGAVLNNKTPERWQAALIALGVACRKNADIPTAAARTLCDKRNRPEGPIKLPDECRPFYELMKLAKVIPND